MQERDVPSMPSVKAWQKPKVDNLKQAASDAKLQLTDAKQKPLLDAISTLLKGVTYDIHGDITDLKYRYILDTLMVRVRAALTEKLEAYGTDEYEAINNCIAAFNKLNLKQLATIDDKVDEALDKLVDVKEEIVDVLLKAIKSCNNKTLNTELHKKNLNNVLSLFEKRQKNNQDNKQLQKNSLQSLSVIQRINKQTQLLEKRLQQIAKSNVKSFKMTNLTVKSNISSLDDKIRDQFDNVNSQIDSISDSISQLSTGSFLTGMFSGITGFITSIFKSALFGVLAAGKWLLKIPMALINYAFIKPLKWMFGNILKPFKFALSTILKFIGNIFDTMKSAAGSILKTFLSTPVGLGIVAFAAGFIWQKWISPIWNEIISPIWNKIVEWWEATKKSLAFIFEPLGEWMNGKKSFKDSMKDIWQRLTDELTTWWKKLNVSIKESLFGEDAYEHDKKGNRIKETVKSFGKEENIDKTRSWIDILIEKLLPQIKIVINGILDFKVGHIPKWGDVTLRQLLIIWAIAATAHYGIAIVKDAISIFKGLSKIPGVVKTLAQGAKHAINAVTMNGARDAVRLLTGSTTVPTVQSVPTATNTNVLKGMLKKELVNLLHDATGKSKNQLKKMTERLLRSLAKKQTLKTAEKVTENTVKTAEKVVENTVKAGSKLGKIGKLAKGVGVSLAADLGTDLAIYGAKKAFGIDLKLDANGNVVQASGLGYDIADTAASMAMAAGPFGIAAGTVIKAGTEAIRQIDELAQVNQSFEDNVAGDVAKTLEMWKKAGELQKTELKDLEANLKNIDYYDKSMSDLEQRVKDTSGRWYGIWHPGEHAMAIENLENAKARRESLLKLTGYSSVEDLRAAITEMKTPTIDYETQNTLQQAIDELRKIAQLTELIEDDKQVEMMQKALNSGNKDIIEMLKKILFNQDKQMQQPASNSAFLFAPQQKYNPAIIENMNSY